MKGAYENRLLLVLTLAGGVAGVDVFALSFLSPFVTVDLHISNTQLGFIGALSLVSWATSATFGAVLSDRIGRRKIFLLATFVLFAVASIGSGLARTYEQLLAARLVVGLTQGPVIPIMQSILMVESSASRRGFNMGVAQHLGAQAIGAVVSPIVLVWIASAASWRVAFFCAALPSLVIVALISKVVREPLRRATSRRTSLEILMSTVSEVLRRRNLRLCVAIGGCCVAWLSLLMTFLPLWATHARGMTTHEMSLLMSGVGMAGTLSALIVSWASDRIGRRPAMTLFTLFGACGPVALLDLSNTSYIGLVVFLSSLLTGTFALFTAVIPLETAKSADAATTAALVLSGAQLLGFLGPIAGGYLADRYSLDTTLMLMAGLATAAAVASNFLQETAPSVLNARRD